MPKTTEPETETHLCAMAERDTEAAVAGIRRGLDSSAARRVRPAEEVFADIRAMLVARSHLTEV